jgi:hypothetical protein
MTGGTSEGRHEASRWPSFTPGWAVQLRNMIQQVLANQATIIRNQETEMALTDDLKTEIAALQAEDGVIITALNDLKAKAVDGTVADTDVQAAIDSIKAELTRVDAIVQTDDPPAPTPPPVP